MFYMLKLVFFMSHLTAANETGSPLSIEVLDLDRAMIVNTSNKEVSFFHHNLIAPVELTLKDDKGEKESFRDEREIMKYDTTPYCGSVVHLKPKEGIFIKTRQYVDEKENTFKEILVNDSNKEYWMENILKYTPSSIKGPKIHWQSQKFQLKKGKYTARLAFTSSYAICCDKFSDNTKEKEIKNVWLGKIISSEFTIVIN